MLAFTFSKSILMIPKEKKPMNSVMKFIKDEEGLTTVEYAVAGTLIALAVVVAFRNLGNTVNNSITAINTQLGTP